MKDALRVKDLYLASFLYADARPLVKIERDAGICWFYFADYAKSKERADEYWTGRASCNAKNYADAIRTLKDRIFGQV